MSFGDESYWSIEKTVNTFKLDHLRQSKQVISQNRCSFNIGPIYMKCRTEGSKINGLII